MTVSVSWDNIRPLNSSQQLAFEELCCELAASEPYSKDSTFWRVSAPDAGVECYWCLPDGKEHGWQAKFFRSPPTGQQWQQLDKSVKTALAKHPTLVRYTICLPIDRSAPHTKGKKSFMDSWNAHVRKWEKWGKRKRNSLKIQYWGQHEILGKLSKVEHRGRVFFWFNQETFTPNWFEGRFEETRANVGPRYSPELNVDLPIAGLFDCLGRTHAFHSTVDSLGKEINDSSRRLLQTLNRYFKTSKLESSIQRLLESLANVHQSFPRSIDSDELDRLALVAMGFMDKFDKELDAYKNDSDFFEYAKYCLGALNRSLKELMVFGDGKECASASRQLLVVVGEAGVGKTHLLCDVTANRLRSGLPTVLLLGAQFHDEEPWSQIVHLLGLTCSRDEFLGALDAAGQMTGSRVLLLIDAINEGEGPRFWNKFVPGMLATIKRYPWIGLAVTVRSSYEDLVLPKTMEANMFVKEEHRGFINFEYKAAQTFLAYFGITHFGPLIAPEFRNPLFLKLLCEGLRNKGLTAIPQGLEGLTALFGFFTDSLNEKISRDLSLDLHDKVVSKAIQKIASMISDTRETWLRREDVKTAMDKILPGHDYEGSLFKHLISEGLISEERYRVKDESWQETVRFTYEQFAHHAVVDELIVRYVNPADPTSAFLHGKSLGWIVEDEGSCWRYKSLIDALAIQLPERFGKELYEVVPHCVGYRPIAEAFITSLIWRTPKAIGKSTLTYINNYVIKDHYLHDKLTVTFLTVAVNPSHPYNGDFLHKNLAKLDLGARDASWSIFLHEHYDSQSAVDSLLDWAELSDRLTLDKESLRLFGTVLVWFFTSSNRYLRDRATKAVVQLLNNHIDVLREIVARFIDVNDPYVLERLLAAAYGCALRNKSEVKDLAASIYSLVFEKGTPPANILLRDYARGIIEVALHSGAKLEIDVGKFHPPYTSDPPTAPALEEVKAYGEVQKNASDEELARVQIYSSVIGMGDFARYIIGSDHPSSFRWSAQTLAHDEHATATSQSERFDVAAAQRWILKRTFDLGWSVKRFGWFDRRNSLSYPGDRGWERIGKKYQWIAYHEFLARMSDNQILLTDDFQPKAEKFDGPWQLHGLRDIDPSFLLRKTLNQQAVAWWCPVTYDDWNPPSGDVQWLNRLDDLPSIEKILEVRNPTDNSKWLNLETFCEWVQPVPSSEDPDLFLQRRIWFMIRSYIVKLSDAAVVFNWIKKQNLMGRWMPESRSLSDVLLGEYFWSPAYLYHNSRYYGEYDWTRGSNNIIPRPILVTAEEYLREAAGYDCSIDETVRLTLPCRWLANAIGISCRGTDGEFFNDKSCLVAFDPSAKTPGPAALLVSKDILIKSLHEKGYTLFWTLLGERNIITPIGKDSKWKGRLEVSGVFMFDGKHWRKSLKTLFRKPPRKSP